jgi:DNA-binding NarL/FixJ family response regulator
MATKILLADDHRLLLDGLRSLLENNGKIEVVGVASDGHEAANLSRELKPDIILLDISMPGLNGIDAARRILAERPETRIIMLSMHSDRRFVSEALKAGAVGYVLKESAYQEVFEAIRCVLNSKVYFSQTIREQVLNDYIKRLRDESLSAFTELSEREREVLQLLAEGSGTKEIATQLNISVKTVETHRKHIMDKLGMRSIAELTK